MAALSGYNPHAPMRTHAERLAALVAVRARHVELSNHGSRECPPERASDALRARVVAEMQRVGVTAFGRQCGLNHQNVISLRDGYRVSQVTIAKVVARLDRGAP